MFRYLREAFFARPEVKGLGQIPLNVLGLIGAGLFGFVEPSIWVAGLGLETIYLFSLASNHRFRQWVDGRELLRLREATGDAEELDASKLGQPAKERLARLEERIATVESLYRENQNEDYLFESNREALRKLASLFLKLLLAQRNILAHSSGPAETDLKKQISRLNDDVLSGTGSQTLRDSKRATIQIVEQRLLNLQKREETLAEIDSDLTRIEAQIDLALEDATLKGRPIAISANIGLVSHLLDDTLLSSTTTTAGSSQIEN